MVKNAVHPSGKKLVNSIMASHTAINRPGKTFILKSSVEFASRSSDVFNQLNSLERDHKSWISKNETHDSFGDGNNTDNITSKKPDNFKKPFAPARKRKESFSPQRRNIKKWRKYSLADVPLSSDAKNSAVALQFLDELRKKKECKVDEVTSSDEKAVYRRPIKRKREASKTDASPEKDCLKMSKCSNPNVKLDHLDDIDDF